MALTRRAFFERVAAIAVGSVLAARPQFKSRMWFTAPTFEHREFYGIVTISHELLERSARDGGEVLRVACENFNREMDRKFDEMIADMNRELLNGTSEKTPKGFLSGY